MEQIEPQKIVVIRYTNYRGETAVRRVYPLHIRFAATSWHPEPQWLLEAYDVEKEANRSFALKDIQDWNAAEQVVARREDTAQGPLQQASS